jgi:hypothetical protein
VQPSVLADVERCGLAADWRFLRNRGLLRSALLPPEILRRHAVPTFERAVKRHGLRVADEVRDFANRQRRFPKISGRRFLSGVVEQLLIRDLFDREPSL